MDVMKGGKDKEDAKSHPARYIRETADSKNGWRVNGIEVFFKYRLTTSLLVISVIISAVGARSHLPRGSA